MTHSLPQDQLVKHQPPRRQAGSSPWIEKATTISKVLGKDFWSTWVHKMGHWALTHAVLSFINIHTSRSFNRHCTKCKDALGAVGSVVRYYHGNASLAKSPHWSPMAENTPKRTSELPLGNIHPQLHQRMEALLKAEPTNVVNQAAFVNFNKAVNPDESTKNIETP